MAEVLEKFWMVIPHVINKLEQVISFHVGHPFYFLNSSPKLRRYRNKSLDSYFNLFF